MFDFFAPRYVKEANAIWKNASKMLCYKRDLLSPATIAQIEEQLRSLHRAASLRDKPAAEAAAQKLEEHFSTNFPPKPDAGWRENTEVFLVAIVIAIGVRTYFLQPFTIPTGSMQPTLNGIIGHVTNEPAPNPLTRILHYALLGKSYVDAVAKSDGDVTGISERNYLFFFTLTTVQCGNETYRMWAPRDALGRYFNVNIARIRERGR
jgi:signal peptidase I